MEPVFFLFEHEGHVLRSSEDGEQPFTDFPCRVWFTACDFLNGNGWGWDFFEAHGTIIEDYPHDVGCGDETQAVLVEVPTEADFLALAAKHEVAESVPARLN